MPEFAVVKEKSKTFGRNGYIEVALKQVDDGTDSRQFFTVTRGYINQEGARRWVRYVTLPADPGMVDFITKTIEAFATTKPTEAPPIAPSAI